MGTGRMEEGIGIHIMLIDTSLTRSPARSLFVSLPMVARKYTRAYLTVSLSWVYINQDDT